MSLVAIDNSEVTILARVISTGTPTVSAEAASEFLKWGFSDTDKGRMSELASKARQGTLSREEQIEIESYERVSSFLGLLKSLARRSLQSPSGR